MARYDKHGNEIPDNTPIEIPLGYKVPETLQQQMQRMIRSEAMAQYARAQGAETFEESNDFDVGDDEDPSSIHELDDQEIEFAQARKELQAAQAAAGGPKPPPAPAAPPAPPQPNVEAKPGGTK